MTDKETIDFLLDKISNLRETIASLEAERKVLWARVEDLEKQIRDD